MHEPRLGEVVYYRLAREDAAQLRGGEHIGTIFPLLLTSPPFRREDGRLEISGTVFGFFSTVRVARVLEGGEYGEWHAPEPPLSPASPCRCPQCTTQRTEARRPTIELGPA